ncbi:Clp protease N-terminal domain-containing protein [Streptomyces sp. NPDC057381]|uniref:Clp protease N-terminal domain-containing protein n=1 Tax=Streptomyces sp. NPDC057381 TaxID=3346111 RepID=UPI0036275F8B
MTDPNPQFTPRLHKILGAAEALARSLGHEHVGTEHVFLAIVQDADAVPTQILEELVAPQRVSQALEEHLRAPEYLGDTQPTVDGEQPDLA